MLVSAIDKQRIQVLTRSTPTPNLQGIFKTIFIR